jgi:hypothetical protein
MLGEASPARRGRNLGGWLGRRKRVPSRACGCYLSVGRLGTSMLTNLTHYARWLDLWLHKHIGRPYESLLAIGLGLSIVASVNNLGQIIGRGGAILQGELFKTLGIVIFQAALLINQLAQLDERRARRRRRRMRAREKGRVAAAGPER